MTPPHTVEVVGHQVVEKEAGKVVSRKDLDHVRRGYRATLSNERTSEEAKQHARDRLRELESESEGEEEEETSHAAKSKSKSSETTSSSPSAGSTKHRKSKGDGEHKTSRIIGGLKAALHNPNVHDEHKVEIRQRLDELGVEYEG